MRVFPLLSLALLLAGCQRDTADTSAGTSANAAAVPPTSAAATAPVAAADADVTMRYACDADTSVAIVGGNRARVTLPEGRVVSLSKIAGSTPPVYTGAGLYFAIGSSDAHLSQAESSNDLTCRPQ